MSTPIDKALNSKNLFISFAALITAATAWSVWGQDMFPAASSDSKSESANTTTQPETWSEAELRKWLKKRNLPIYDTESREDLLKRVQNILSNLHASSPQGDAGKPASDGE
ncbi:hypothetical protein SMMN14_07598 [Sphaerulina musiva]